MLCNLIGVQNNPLQLKKKKTPFFLWRMVSYVFSFNSAHSISSILYWYKGVFLIIVDKQESVSLVLAYN